MSSFHSYLVRSLYFLAPKLLALLFVFISTEPIYIADTQILMPLLSMMCIYYWGLYYPKLFPAWFVLLLGILEDVLFGLPLSITGFSNLVLYGIVLSQQKFLLKEPFWVQWCGFALFSFCAVLTKWVLAMLTLHVFYLPDNVLMQWLVSCVSYTLVHLLCSKIYMTLLNTRYA